jgi:hypothetical protein
MSEPTNNADQKIPFASVHLFGDEMFIEEAGFSFRPIAGFELEVDNSVYMYSEDGNLEVCMIGGELENQTSLAELNDELAADFMANFDEFVLTEAGKDTVQGITGLVNDIRFTNAEEEGLGKALICSPHINQFFFMLVIASAEHWLNQGQEIFSAAKSQIHFHPKFKPTANTPEVDKHPDLTIETYDSIVPEENLLVTIVRGDISLLLAARTSTIQDEIALIEIVAPGDQLLYHYNPGSGEFFSEIANQPILSSHGEVCLLLPFPSQQTMQIGNYRFAFATKSGSTLQEVQVIIRQGRALSLQKLDLNLWLALEDETFNEPEYLAEFEANLRSALKEHLASMNMAPGKIETYHPAPDELATFACINLDSDLADCSYMIAESVDNGRALNIGLVDRFTRGDPASEAEMSAVSSGSPGMILSPVSPHACILVNYSVFKDDFSALANAIIKQLVAFCGLAPETAAADQPLALNHDLIWRLRHHPIFYNAD